MRPALLALILLFSMTAMAETAIYPTSPNNNSFSDSFVQTYSANISSNTNITSCALLINGSQKNLTNTPGSNQVLTMLSTSTDGSYSYSITCTDSLTTNSSTGNINIDTVKPTINMLGPENRTKATNRTIIFGYVPSDGFLKNCSIYTNQSGFSLAQTKAASSQSSNYFNLTLNDNSYLWAIKCNDSLYETWSGNYTLTVDSSPPTITSFFPSSITKTQTTLNITTSENATCKYSLTNNTAISQMIQMSVTGTAEHSINVVDLTDGNHAYYFKCLDYQGNNMTEDFSATLSVLLPPTAEVIMERPSPVKAGIMQVTVLTSRSMLTTPQLTYLLNDPGATAKNIPLSAGSTNNLWTGYIAIEDAGNRKVGTFSFSGTDNRGVTGTEITSGKSFIIDTEKPTAPISLKTGVLESGNIKITWYYDDEDVAAFYIYRSTASGVDYTDIIASTNTTSYIDTTTSDKTTYYYKINVIDRAGNRGPLSGEVYATSISKNPVQTQQKEEDVPKVLPPNLIPKVNDQIKEVEGLILDINGAGQSFSAQSSQSQSMKELIILLKINDRISDAKKQLAQEKEYLESLKGTYMTETELDNTLNKVEEDLTIIRQKIPISLKIIESVRNVEQSSKEDLSAAIELGISGLSPEQKSKYLNDAYQASQKIKVESQITTMKLEYPDGSIQDKALIKKFYRSTGTDTFSEVIVVETIPKTVAEDISFIEPITQDYEVIKSDPIIKWGILELGAEEKTIEYFINNKLDANGAKLAKSAVLTQLNKIDGQKVTGLSIFSIFEQQTGMGKGSVIFILIGISTVAILFLYYKGFIGGSEINDPVGLRMQNKEYGAYMLAKTMIIDAKDHLNNGRVNEAEAIYPQIQRAYSNLPTNLKGQIYQDCIYLQSAIASRKSYDNNYKRRY